AGSPRGKRARESPAWLACRWHLPPGRRALPPTRSSRRRAPGPQPAGRRFFGPGAGKDARRKARRGEGDRQPQDRELGVGCEGEAARGGYWQAVQDRLARGFDPGWDVLEQGPKDAPRSSLGAFIDSWKKQAAAYGRSGNPFSGVPGAPGATRPLHDEFIELAKADPGPDSVSLGKTLHPST